MADAKGTPGASVHGGDVVFPTNPDDYQLLEEAGHGASAVVWRALCKPLNQIVSVKVLDLERAGANLEEVRKETATMSMINHPNLVRAHASFVYQSNLWVIMPYLSGGSCLNIMRTAYPNGFPETIIVTILKETLKALDYLHRHNYIHRDVKAGNILVDDDGTVKVTDFGVSATMQDSGDRTKGRQTFVGTPCWMAPEVMEQLHAYDTRADIWSFGITCLELAHGHAPFSKYPPMKVLLMTLQNAPPSLDMEPGDKDRFSKAFREVVGMCLQKNPAKRPSAEKLLKHSFFKGAKSPEYLKKHLLEGLPPLGERVKQQQAKDPSKREEAQEATSVEEYQKGVSGWNFDVGDLKKEAEAISLESIEEEAKKLAHGEEGPIRHHLIEACVTSISCEQQEVH
eukprot:jgi/Mesvir1/23990/Mv10747-RA.2